jgi:hypothetical protein
MDQSQSAAFWQKFESLAAMRGRVETYAEDSRQEEYLDVPDMIVGLL